MTKHDYIRGLAKELGVTQDKAYEMFDKIEKYTLDCLATAEIDDSVPFLGKLEVVGTKERTGRNPKKPNETHLIPAGRKLKYKPSTLVKETIK